MAQPFFATLKGVSSILLVGGLDIQVELKKVEEEGANILVGTPGKLFDIMERLDTLEYKHLEVALVNNGAVFDWFLLWRRRENMLMLFWFLCALDADSDLG